MRNKQFHDDVGLGCCGVDLVSALSFSVPAASGEKCFVSARCVCPLWSFLFFFLRVVRGGDKGGREVGFDDGYFGMSLTVLLFFLCCLQ